MSFIDHYLKKYRLEKLSGKAKKNLSKLESKIDKFVSNSKGPLTFEDCLKEHGTEIADLVERISKAIDQPFNHPIGYLRFVSSISFEAYQIVEAMSGCVVDESMSQEEQHTAKVGFGKQLVYFIWMTVDPLKDRFNWVPFKKTVVKRLVLWLAGMALESVVDLFEASGRDKTTGVFKTEGQPLFIKAIP